jgi:homoserine O-acetyltransferase
VTIAYHSLGRLAPGGRNAICVLHGYTSSPGLIDHGTVEDGLWRDLFGPGKAIDTDRYFVICPNALGGSHGSTSPASIDPATGRPFGSRFPALTLGDLVAANRLLLRDLGVGRLVAVMGPSFGGAQALQWAADYPAEMGGVVAAIAGTAAHNPSLPGLLAQLLRNPDWHGGDYYGRGDLTTMLVRLRKAMLKTYGVNLWYDATIPTPAGREAALHHAALVWARQFDANSLVTLRKAQHGYDLRPRLARIRARVLYVLSRSDPAAPPSLLAADVMGQFRNAGIDAQYCEVDSDYGHFGTGIDADKWAPQLRAFIDGLDR